MKNFRLKSGPHSIKILHGDNKKINEFYDSFSLTVNSPAPIDKAVYKLWGFYFSPNMIFLNNEIKSKSHYISVLVHELTEMINDHYGLELDHDNLSTLAEVWSQLLLLNSDKFIEIIGNKDAP